MTLHVKTVVLSSMQFVHRPRTAAGPPIKGLTITSQAGNYHVSGRIYLGLYNAQPAIVMVGILA